MNLLRLLGVLTTLALAGCGNGTPSTGDAHSAPLTVAATAVPHAEILRSSSRSWPRKA